MGVGLYSDQAVSLALWIGGVAVVLTFFLMVQIVIVRALVTVTQARRRRVAEIWEQILIRSLEEAPAAFEPVKRRYELTLVKLWHKLHMTVAGDTEENLNRAARIIGIDKAARRFLKKRNFEKRLIAISVLGKLRDESVWEELREIAASDAPVLSIAAASSLAQINPERAVEVLMPHISTRGDWPRARVASILNDLGPALVSEPLSRAALEAPPERAPRLIRYLESTHSVSARPVVRRILNSTIDDEVRVACLFVIGKFANPEDLDLVRTYPTHPNWVVRLQAALAIGAMGTEEDVQTLERLLTDWQWWVRYRAAEALVSLPFLTVADIRKIQGRLNDPYAHDMLDQVLAEKGGL